MFILGGSSHTKRPVIVAHPSVPAANSTLRWPVRRPLVDSLRRRPDAASISWLAGVCAGSRSHRSGIQRDRRRPGPGPAPARQHGAGPQPGPGPRPAGRTQVPPDRPRHHRRPHQRPRRQRGEPGDVLRRRRHRRPLENDERRHHVGGALRRSADVVSIGDITIGPGPRTPSGPAPARRTTARAPPGGTASTSPRTGGDLGPYGAGGSPHIGRIVIDPTTRIGLRRSQRPPLGAEQRARRLQDRGRR